MPVIQGMSDGRCFTDYRSSCLADAAIQRAFNIASEHEYRQFIQRNAKKVAMQARAGKTCVLPWRT